MAKLSIIIPIFNEAEHLDEVLDRLFAAKMPCETEYVFVEDGSLDSSWQVLSDYFARKDLKNVVLHRQPANQGKGAALHKGFALASGNIIAVHDADFEYDPNDIGRLVEPILSGTADVVYGSRFSKSSPQVHRTFHYLVNRCLTLLSNVFSGLYVHDMETCYKVFKAEVLKSLRLECKRFGFEPEVTAKIAKLKLRVHEYPISYFPRTYLEGKKISWRDGVAAVWFILKFNLRKFHVADYVGLDARFIPRDSNRL